MPSHASSPHHLSEHQNRTTSSQWTSDWDSSLFCGSRMVYFSSYLFSSIICAMFLLSQVLNCSSGITLAPVYWNSSNTFFKQSKNSHTIEVSLQDQIDFVCPFYYPREYSNTSAYEYYTVYQVSRQNYEDCNISRESAIMIVNCSNPIQHKRFTILFEMFQAIPNAPEFVPGNTYYYVSTSSGRIDGLSNNYLGACHWLNMKLIIYVCCDVKSVEPSIVSPSSPSSKTPVTQFVQNQSSESQSSKSFPLKSQIFVITVPYDKSRDIPRQDSGFTKQNENDVSPKHQGLTNNSPSVFHPHRIIATFLPCFVLILMYFVR